MPLKGHRLSFLMHLVGIAILTLSGCQSIPDAPREVMVPVPVSCIDAKDLPAIPTFITDADLAKMSDADLIIALRSDQLAYRGYVPLIEAILAGCAK